MNKHLVLICRSLLTLLILLTAAVCQAQQKYEKEIRIGTDEVPEQALKLLDSLQLEKQVKWYKELGIETSSIEAKAKHKGKRHSIEFSKDGSFEDLEIEIKKSEIPSEALAEIVEHLNSEAGNFKLKKVQIQYSGNPSTVIRHFKGLQKRDQPTIRFELVVSRHVEGSYSLYEYLFDEDGAFVGKVRIILNMTDNLEY